MAPAYRSRAARVEIGRGRISTRPSAGRTGRNTGVVELVHADVELGLEDVLQATVRHHLARRCPRPPRGPP